MSHRKLVLPPLVRTARDAEAFARHAHFGQFDKVGDTYICHVERVVARVRVFAPWASAVDGAVQVAWLHDVVEDTPYTADDLKAEGFDHAVVSTVCLLTRDGGGPYARFIQDIASDTLTAILVKLADNLDNADPHRLALAPEEDRDRLRRKYAASIPILREAAFARGWTPRLGPGETIRGLWPDRSPASSDRGGL